ncbi:metal ABC transporter solute-binding protein, Zn/Mn family [Bacillus solitudinis]|uniref:metal ABC transporter solute-binding protein, Zn/Mn family n=1 Tax=Bacillus solitudinis TaxID=2014074 RepID=UPI000C250848|nr:zinc ABC transporter substrate-binding protein [Bacillus solitudinis]
MKLSFNLFAMILVLSALLAACGGQGEVTEDVDTENQDEGIQEETERLELFTTIFPLEDFASKIGGDFVHVTNLVPVGADAHTFEPTARQMIEIVEGDAFIYNGAGLEGFVDAIINTVTAEDVLIVQASEGTELLETHDEHANEEEDAHAADDHAHEEDDNAHDHDKDPHIWLDPILSITIAENIKNTLVQLMPEQEQYFTANFEEVKSELEAVNLEFQEMVSEASKDTFLVSHEGYGYWEERYGIHQRGIAGLSPTNEPSQRQLQEVIEFAHEYEIEYILFEQNVTPNIAEIVKGEVGAEVVYIHNLEALVQEDIDNDEDYFSLMRRNIESLRMALQ